MKRRTRKKNNTHSQKEINYAARAKYVRKFTSLPFSNKTRFSPQQKAAVTRAWKHYRNYRNTHHIATKDKKTRDRLKAAGFVVTNKGAFIDKPRDSEGKSIKGVRLRVLKSGIVAERFNERITHTIGIPKRDRLKFADDPCEYLARLYPKYRKKLTRPGVVVQLMWGAFASNSPMKSEQDICNSVFNYLHDSEGEVRKERLHNLTGLRIVEHVEKKRKKSKKAKKTTKRKYLG